MKSKIFKADFPWIFNHLLKIYVLLYFKVIYFLSSEMNFSILKTTCRNKMFLKVNKKIYQFFLFSINCLKFIIEYSKKLKHILKNWKRSEFYNEIVYFFHLICASHKEPIEGSNFDSLNIKNFFEFTNGKK